MAAHKNMAKVDFEANFIVQKFNKKGIKDLYFIALHLLIRLRPYLRLSSVQRPFNTSKCSCWSTLMMVVYHESLSLEDRIYSIVLDC